MVKLKKGDRKNFSEVSNRAVGLPDGVQRYAEWQSLEVAKSKIKKRNIRNDISLSFFIKLMFLSNLAFLFLRAFCALGKFNYHLER